MHITITTLLVWALIAFFVGIVGELIARRRTPDGFIGATILGFLAILLIVGILHLAIPGDIILAGVPLLTSIIVAALIVALWSSFAYRRYYRPTYERYYYRRGNYARRPRRRWWR